jgi:ketosteroid isomerase-like protein
MSRKGDDSEMKARRGRVEAQVSTKGRTMASDEGFRDSAPRSPVTAVGIDHVCLSYHYLDQGDIDGYLSLLHADVSLYLPSKQEICGREQIAAFQARLEGPAGEHLICGVMGSGDRVVAEGRYVSRETGQGVDFTEVFRLSEEGLLRSQKRYYFVEPT